jgi:hypothetical protein
MTNYKWVIFELNCIPKEGEMTDVVSVINWRRIAEQYIDAELVQVSVYGTISCPSPSETDFTAYPDLTYEQICSWLDAGLNVAELDANLDIQIENIINPPIVTLPLPWIK